MPHVCSNTDIVSVRDSRLVYLARCAADGVFEPSVLRAVPQATIRRISLSWRESVVTATWRMWRVHPDHGSPESGFDGAFEPSTWVAPIPRSTAGSGCPLH